MAPNIRHFSLILLLLSTLCSCGTLTEGGVKIYELIFFHNNGSGKFEIIVDLSGVKKFTTLEKYLIERNYTQKTAQKEFQTTAQKLEQIKGVHKVCTAYDQELLYFKLDFIFSNLHALNSAMRAIFFYVDPAEVNYFTMNAHKFVRLDMKSIARLVDYYQAKDNTYIASFDLHTFFRNTTYKTIYTFNKKIKKCANRLSKFSESGKTVVVECRIFDEEDQNSSIGNKIIF